MFKVELCTAVDQPLHRLQITLLKRRRMALDKREERAILEQRHLDCFRDPAPPVTIVKRHEEGGVIQHGARRRECAQKVLLAERVDAIFDAHG